MQSRNKHYFEVEFCEIENTPWCAIGFGDIDFLSKYHIYVVGTYPTCLNAGYYNQSGVMICELLTTNTLIGATSWCGDEIVQGERWRKCRIGLLDYR